MASSSEMRLIIAQLRCRVMQSPVFVVGRPDSAAKADKAAVQLETISDTLHVIIRDLASSESMIRVRQAELRRIPYDRRWSARQSLSQLGEDLNAVKLEAEALADLVKDLLIRNGVLNPVQKTKALIDLMKELEKAAGHELPAQLTMLRHETTIGPVPHGAPRPLNSRQSSPPWHSRTWGRKSWRGGSVRAHPKESRMPRPFSLTHRP
jgi:hypothetical protein